MPPKVTTPDLSGLSDEALAREVISNARTMATSQRDPWHGRPTRQEGLRRVAALSVAIEAQAAELAREITAQLSKGSGAVAPGDVARLHSLIAVAGPEHPVWSALEAEVSAPDRPDIGSLWSTDTDEERDGQASEARNIHVAAKARSLVLADEVERRRQAAEFAREVEQLARYRARSGV